MKRKVKITIEMNVEYPQLNKETKTLSKDFDDWVISWSSNPENHPLPLLFKRIKGELEAGKNSWRKRKFAG